jgi:transposase-like protein
LSDWTDELKAQVVKDYLSQSPTQENSMDIVKDIADELGKTANGVRMILSKAGVYVTKGTPAKKEGGEKKATGGTRVSKESAQAALIAAIEAAGKEVDEEIISKLTGKAAQYFTGLFK